MTDDTSMDSGSESTESTETTETTGQADAVEIIQPKLSKRLRLKIDNEEFDEELPFEFDENNKAQVEYLKRHLQMSKVANKRMSESATTRKQTEKFLEALQNDPVAVLSDERIMGSQKFRQIAEEYLTNQLRNEMLSPEERHQAEMQAKLKNYEKIEAQRKTESESKEMEALENHYGQVFEKTIISALENSKLPKNTFTVKRMASLLHTSHEHGLDLDPNHLAELVLEDYQKELRAITMGADADTIVRMFGNEISTKLRKRDLENFRKTQPNFNQNSNRTQSYDSSGEAQARPLRRSEFEAQYNKNK